jgi:hypothetical protein
MLWWNRGINWRIIVKVIHRRSLLPAQHVVHCFLVELSFLTIWADSRAIIQVCLHHFISLTLKKQQKIEKNRGIVTVMSALLSTNFHLDHNFLSIWCIVFILGHNNLWDKTVYYPPPKKFGGGYRNSLRPSVRPSDRPSVRHTFVSGP